MPDQKNLLFILLALVGVVANLIAFFMWDSSFITNDGVQYLSTAENWLKGNGFSTNALMYNPHFQGELPGPQTVWPPGYPLILALLGMFGLKLTTVGLVLNLVAHACASVLLVLILKRMRITTNYAVICMVLFYGMTIPWNFARGLITEPVFTCFIFAAILFLPVPGRSKLSTWALCGVLVACCIYIRYSAVIYAAGVGFGIFSFLLFQNRSNWDTLVSGCLQLAVLTVIPVAAFLHLMYRTNTLTGTVERNAGTRAPESLYFSIRQWGAHSADLLGFNKGGLYSLEIGVFLFLLTVALVVSLAVYAGIKYREDDVQDHCSEQALYSRIVGFVVMAHGLLMFLYLTYCAMTDSPLQILARYLYQVYPGVYLLFCVLMYGLMNRVRNQQTKSIPLPLQSIFTILISIYVLAQVNGVTSSQRYFAEGQAAQKMLTLPVTGSVTLRDYVDSCMMKYDEGSIWGSHGQHLHFNIGVPTLTLAEIYTNQAPDFSRIEQQLETYKIKLMVFLNQDAKIGTEYRQHMTEIKEWLSDNGHQLVALEDNMVNSHTSVDVYQINEQCESAKRLKFSSDFNR